MLAPTTRNPAQCIGRCQSSDKAAASETNALWLPISESRSLAPEAARLSSRSLRTLSRTSFAFLLEGVWEDGRTWRRPPSVDGAIEPVRQALCQDQLLIGQPASKLRTSSRKYPEDLLHFSCGCRRTAAGTPYRRRHTAHAGQRGSCASTVPVALRRQLPEERRGDPGASTSSVCT